MTDEQREVSRRASNRINDLLDDWLPPKLRDSRAFGRVARWLYRETSIPIDRFKDEAFYLDREAYSSFYSRLAPRFEQGETDLTPASFRAVLDAVEGDRVLDVACGDGLMLERLAPRSAVGVDVYVNPRARTRARRLLAANIQDLPFPDAAFDTVISTHTLEHVQRLPEALAELRRVAGKRLVVVVPRQRPYRVTFNPHIHFFPYAWSLLAFTGTDHPHRIEQVDSDWLYVEDRTG